MVHTRLGDHVTLQIYLSESIRSARRSQLGCQLTAFSPILLTEKLLHIESPLIFQDKVNSPAQLVGINSQSLSFVVFSTQAIDEFFGLVRFAQTDRGSGSDGPFEMGVADFFVGPSGPLAVGLFFGSNQPGIGAKALHRAKAPDVVHFVQNCQRKDLAHTGNSPE